MLKNIALLCSLLAPSTAFAQNVDWAALGAAAKGVGNAGVAFSEGTGGSYWNPAAIASGGGGGISLFGGFGINLSGYGDIGVEGDTLAVVDKIHDFYSAFDMEATQARMASGTATAQDFQNLIQLLDTIRYLDQSETGAFLNAGAGIDLRFGSFGVFHREFGNAALDPEFNFGSGISFAGPLGGTGAFYGQIPAAGALSAAGTQLRDNLLTQWTAAGFAAGQNADADADVDVDELAFQAQAAVGDAVISDPGFQSVFIAAAIASNTVTGANDTLAFNTSGISTNGILLRETGVTLGIPLNIIPIPVPFLGSVNAGISIKEVIGETFYLKTILKDLEEGQDYIQDLKRQFDENRKRTNQFSADAGISVSATPWLTVGISARNLIPMTFDSAGPEDIEIGPQLRGGVKGSFFGMLSVGFDVDLLENDLDQFIDDYKSRQVAAGAQLTLGIVSIRGGFFDNLSSVDSKGTFSAGLGLRIPIIGIHVDVDGQMAPGTSDVEAGSIFPNYEDSDLKLPERVSVGVSAGWEMGF